MKNGLNLARRHKTITGPAGTLGDKIRGCRSLKPHDQDVIDNEMSVLGDTIIPNRNVHLGISQR
jgi:hypothetical protein